MQVFWFQRPAAMDTSVMLKFHNRRKLPTLLLVDDDLVSREVTATVLTMNGYTVHTAVDGTSALEMLVSHACQPDVVLMDAQMPGLSGTELIGEMRSRTKARIFAMSGSDAPEEVAAAADGFLLKPFGVEALEKALGPTKEEAEQATAESRLDVNEAVISPVTLAQFRGMMPQAAVREIYVAVASDLTKRIQMLEAAIAKGNIPEVRRLGHAIKGGCGMAGAMQAARIGALFEETETGTDSNQLDNRMALLNDLRAAARNLERMLDEI